ncbi:hypothetical protein acsn021_10930 [Anaerocolumna cellulosilytica]|uniref:Uncharacterized protein n=1 Tax=Anaerocolumna cellulosilytica TaxID=433286 RepID=A0A6S6QSD3_9FIRM|nr:hypothetical protein [Anaerocolumna cellulosilytica]MBB5194580.1 hypothetical protein [Anaerocolumna cellulosilytica]BCJ93524.1 hypothetical protein acsn021_10930 [Anaerocolumna cellulosilytica]
MAQKQESRQGEFYASNSVVNFGSNSNISNVNIGRSASEQAIDLSTVQQETSILDYAHKNGMSIIHEDHQIARISAPNGNVLTVDKGINRWYMGQGGSYDSTIVSYGDNNKIENVNLNNGTRSSRGNVVQFIAKMEQISQEEAVDKWYENKDRYATVAEYNQLYRENHPFAQRQARTYPREKSTERVELANTVSIMDYVNQHEIDVVYEDDKVAKVEDIDGGIVTVFKEHNSWVTGDTEYDATREKNYGRTIRFVAKFENCDWKDAMDKLVEDRGDYLSVDEYNAAYLAEIKKRNPDYKVQPTKEERSKVAADTKKAGQVDIKEYLKEKGIPFKELHNGKFIMLNDKAYEGLTIFTQSNTWDWNSQQIKNAGVVKLAERINNISKEEAIAELSAFADGKSVEKISPNVETSNNVEVSNDVDVPNDVEAQKNVQPVKETNQNDSQELQQEQKENKTKPLEKEGDPAGQAEANATFSNVNYSENSDIKQQAVNPMNRKRTMNKEQLSQILSGLRLGIDITPYDNPNLSAKQMEQLKRAIVQGVDVSDFNSPELSPEFMKEMRLAAASNIDLSVFKNAEGKFIFDDKQAKEIRLGCANGLTAEEVSIFAYKDIDADAMKELRLGLQDGLYDIKKLNTGNYTAKDIHTIRMTLVANRILESILSNLRNLHDSIIDLIKRSIQFAKQEPKMTQPTPVTLPNELDIASQATAPEATGEEIKVDIEKEAKRELRDIIEELCEALEEKMPDISMEQKMDAVKASLRKVLDEARDLEQTVAEKTASEINKAVEEHLDEMQMENLKEAAAESLQEEYVEEFYDNENAYNQSLINFTSKILNDTSLDAISKEHILTETLGATYGEETAKIWIQHISQSPTRDITSAAIPKEYVQEMVTETEVTEEMELVR